MDLVSIDCAGFELFEMIDPNFKDVSAESIAHIKYAIILGVNLLTTH